MPILEGLDGIEKMSKSLGNYVGINEKPKDIYGKLMSIPDTQIIRYFELATDIHPDRMDDIRNELSGGRNPRDIKMKLSWEITAQYHGKNASDEAEKHFISIFQRREAPQDIEVYEISVDFFIDGKADLVKLLVGMGFSPSNSESRRLISQGAVKINGKKIIDIKPVVLSNDDIIQTGKLKYMKLKIK